MYDSSSMHPVRAFVEQLDNNKNSTEDVMPDMIDYEPTALPLSHNIYRMSLLPTIRSVSIPISFK